MRRTVILYAENGASGGLYEINPDTGALVGSGVTQSGFSGTPIDLASCAYNGTLSLEKNIVGRVGTNDQFGLSITGGGITSGNTGVTSGGTTGLQTGSSEEAGPVVGIPGTVYSIAETAASGANLNNYSSTYSCSNLGTTFSGTGTTATLPAFPAPAPTSNSGAAVACTFTNTPASITIAKSASPTSVSAANQTIDYSFLVTNTGPLTLNNITVNDTQTSPAGVLTTGPTCPQSSLASHAFETCSATYTVSQADINHGSIVDSATASGTPTGGTVITSAPSPANVTVTATPGRAS